MLTVALITIVALTLFLLASGYMRSLDSWSPSNHSSTTLEYLKRILKVPSGLQYKIMYDQKTRAKFVRTGSVWKPELVLRDPQLVKDVLTRDFKYFTDRPHRRNSGELFDLDGEQWRTARRKLFPIFSPEPLEGMFKYFTANLGTLVTRISKGLGPATDVIRPLETCVSDIISLAVFGMEVTIGRAKDEFTARALSVIEKGFFQNITASLVGSGPSWETEKYFKGFLREKLQSTRPNDFVDALRKLKEETGDEQNVGRGKPSNDFLDEEYPDIPLQGKPIEITDEFLSDQIYQFLTSGFHPIVSAVTFALYDLSRVTDIQSQIRSEIKTSITRNGGYNYNTIRELRLLDCCVHESLRLHPVVHSLKRVCIKGYEREEVDIKRGECVVVSILGLHRDQNHFQDPDEYMPTRFECSEARKNLFYLPFGRGPRKCIGLHFTLLIIKVILAKLIYQFEFSLANSSRGKPPHKYEGPYILPNDIKFDVTHAKSPSILL